MVIVLLRHFKQTQDFTRNCIQEIEEKRESREINKERNR